MDVSSPGSTPNSRWKEVSASVFTGKSLPTENNPVTAQWTAAEQAFLPKPSLDFSKSLPRAKRLRRARGSFTPTFSGGGLRLGLFLSGPVFAPACAGSAQHSPLPEPGGTQSHA